MLDEISTRKSVNVKAQSQTYTGLADFGNNKISDNHSAPNLNDQADHCLVLLFQPLFDTYAQPVAVFASKGPVPGTTLAQLLIQGILHYKI